MFNKSALLNRFLFVNTWIFSELLLFLYSAVLCDLFRVPHQTGRKEGGAVRAVSLSSTQSAVRLWESYWWSEEELNLARLFIDFSTNLRTARQFLTNWSMSRPGHAEMVCTQYGVRYRL